MGLNLLVFREFIFFECHQHHLLNKLLHFKFFFYFLLFKGLVSCFSFFFNCSRGGVRLYLFILIFFTVEEEGAEVKVFFFSFIGHVQRRGKGGLVFNPKSKERKKGKKPLLLLLLN